MRDPFDLDATDSPGGGDFTPCPAGMVPAVVSQLYLVGHQFKSYDDGGERWIPTVIAIVEVSSLVGRKADGSPFLFALEFNASLAKGSKLRGTLESINGTAIADGSKLNLRTFLGAPCLAEVIHKPGTTKKGEPVTYANVKSLKGLPAGMARVDPTIEVLAWAIGQGPLPAYAASLPRIYGATIDDFVREAWETRNPGAPVPAPVKGEKQAAAPQPAPVQPAGGYYNQPAPAASTAPPWQPQPAPAHTAPAWAPQYVPPANTPPPPAQFANLPPTPAGPVPAAANGPNPAY